MDMGPLPGILCVIVGFVLAVVLIIAIFYLITLQKALNRVAPHNRLMEPGMVWLMLIPCVNIVWQFVVAIRVPDSLRNEFRERGQDDGSDYGKSIAIAQAVIGIVSTVISNGARGGNRQVAAAGNLLGGLLSLVGLVLLIVFWVKVAAYSRRLAEDEGGRRNWRRRLEEFDDDEASGTPRKDRPKPPPDTYREGDPGGFKK